LFLFIDNDGKSKNALSRNEKAFLIKTKAPLFHTTPPKFYHALVSSFVEFRWSCVEQRGDDFVVEFYSKGKFKFCR